MPIDVVDIGLARAPSQIGHPVVGGIPIFVAPLHSVRARTDKSHEHQMVDQKINAPERDTLAPILVQIEFANTAAKLHPATVRIDGDVII